MGKLAVNLAPREQNGRLTVTRSDASWQREVVRELDAPIVGLVALCDRV
jgi:hypothetical protein